MTFFRIFYLASGSGIGGYVYEALRHRFSINVLNAVPESDAKELSRQSQPVIGATHAPPPTAGFDHAQATVFAYSHVPSAAIEHHVASQAEFDDDYPPPTASHAPITMFDDDYAFEVGDVDSLVSQNHQWSRSEDKERLPLKNDLCTQEELKNDLWTQEELINDLWTQEELKNDLWIQKELKKIAEEQKEWKKDPEELKDLKKCPEEQKELIKCPEEQKKMKKCVEKLKDLKKCPEGQKKLTKCPKGQEEFKSDGQDKQEGLKMDEYITEPLLQLCGPPEMIVKSVKESDMFDMFQQSLKETKKEIMKRKVEVLGKDPILQLHNSAERSARSFNESGILEMYQERLRKKGTKSHQEDRDTRENQNVRNISVVDLLDNSRAENVSSDSSDSDSDETLSIEEESKVILPRKTEKEIDLRAIQGTSTQPNSLPGVKSKKDINLDAQKKTKEDRNSTSQPGRVKSPEFGSRRRTVDESSSTTLQRKKNEQSSIEHQNLTERMDLAVDHKVQKDSDWNSEQKAWKKDDWNAPKKIWGELNLNAHVREQEKADRQKSLNKEHQEQKNQKFTEHQNTKQEKDLKSYQKMLGNPDSDPCQKLSINSDLDPCQKIQGDSDINPYQKIQGDSDKDPYQKAQEDLDLNSHWNKLDWKAHQKIGGKSDLNAHLKRHEEPKLISHRETEKSNFDIHLRSRAGYSTEPSILSHRHQSLSFGKKKAISFEKVEMDDRDEEEFDIVEVRDQFHPGVKRQPKYTDEDWNQLFDEEKAFANMRREYFNSDSSEDQCSMFDPAQHDIGIINEDPNNPDRNFIEYKNYVISYNKHSMTPLYTLESIRPDNLAQAEHRHCEALEIENAPDSTDINNPKLNHAFDRSYLPYAREPPLDMLDEKKCLQDCPYCRYSTVWKTFYQYYKFLLSRGCNELLVVSGRMAIEDPSEGTVLNLLPNAGEGDQMATATHFYKIIFGKYDDGSIRLECYKYQNKPMQTEVPGLRSFLVPPETIHTNLGYWFFSGVNPRSIKHRKTDPDFSLKPEMERIS